VTVGGTQMPLRVSTGDRDAVLRQIRWCAAVQTLVNCHCKLEENPVGNVEPMQLVVQYLTKTAIKHPSAVSVCQYFATPVSSAKAAKPIEMPFGKLADS